MASEMKILKVSDSLHQRLRVRAAVLGMQLQMLTELVIDLGLDRPLKAVKARTQKRQS